MTAIAFKPLGVILTRMRWNKPAWWIFNAGLLIYQLVMLTAGKLIGKVVISWAEIWRYAQYCHVRLVLEEEPGGIWRCLSITAPEAKFDYWTPGTIAKSRGHFVYLEPTFEADAGLIGRARCYAAGIKSSPRARKYDYLQLLSYLINLPIWLVYWPAWGKQVITWFNLPGGREVCSSGIAALLEWAAVRVIEFFAGFVTAMVSPCLYGVSNRWRKAN